MPRSLSLPSLTLVVVLTARSADSDPAAGVDSLSIPFATHSGSDSTVVSRDSTVATRDSIASDSSAASAAVTTKRGVQDTVTVIRGITVEDTHKIPERSTVTKTRLDRSALVRFQPPTTADALVAAPGVDLVKSGPWASRVSFRGFQGERVLVLVDGVRLNTGRGHGSNTSLVSVDRLDQVELLAGSQGAEYGSDAMGGVFNLVTHRPLFTPAPALGLTLAAHGSEPGDEVTQSSRLLYT